MAPRLIEFLLFVFILYMFYRRIASPFRRGFDQRERERSEFEAYRRNANPGHVHKPTEDEAPKIDKRHIEDAEFEDLD